MIRSPRPALLAVGLVPRRRRRRRTSARNYSPVTDARLEVPEARNWLMYLREYNSLELQPARSRSTPATLPNLAPVWTMSTGTTEGHQAPPIVNDGVMFVTTPFNQVLAIDAKTGDLLWRYASQMPPDIRMRRTRPIAASRSTATRSTSRRPMRASSRSMPRPARSSGTTRSRTTTTATT